MDSDQKLFEDAIRNAYLGEGWLRGVAYEGDCCRGTELIINIDTGECRGGFWGMKMPYPKWKSKVIKAIKRKKHLQRQKGAMIEEDAPIINEIKNIRHSTSKVIK